MELQAPKGTKDMLPKDAYKWHYVENKFKKIAEEYGFKELRTPTFEYTDLFLRGVGETTDVVSKEMYTFLDKGGRSITLKAEGTAPSARAIVESSIYNEMQPTKLYYFTPVFRYENVQKGRFREHHQFGIEMFGSKNPSADAEIISLAMRSFEELGIEGLKLKINSIGHPECREEYNIKLKEFLKENYDSLCDTCKERYHKNPMRILDCKNKSCQLILRDAPLILDNVCDSCLDHFEELKKYLDSMSIPYEVDKRIVRGLDYYSKTVFEIVNKDIAVCGGGRYDYLMEEIGGPEMPAVGFGLGIERLLLTLEQEEIEIPKPTSIDIFIATLGEEAKILSMSLSEKLRRKGLKIDIDHMNKKLKGQMKYANRIESTYTMIIGTDEINNNICSLKNMDTGEQIEVKLDVEEIFNTVK